MGLVCANELQSAYTRILHTATPDLQPVHAITTEFDLQSAAHVMIALHAVPAMHARPDLCGCRTQKQGGLLGSQG